MGRKRVWSLKNIMITVYVGIVILKSFIPFQNLSRLKMVWVFTFTNQTDSSSMNSSHNGKGSIFLNPSIENIWDGSLDPLLNSNPLPVPDFTRGKISKFLNFKAEWINSKFRWFYVVHLEWLHKRLYLILEIIIIKNFKLTKDKKLNFDEIKLNIDITVLFELILH